MSKALNAIVLGATGLVGSALVRELIQNDAFSKITIISRRKTGIEHVKIEEHIINFDKPSSYENLIKGDVLFSAFGTTIKKAGSQDVQYKIDYTYQANIAKAAADNNVEKYILISSAGADSKSRIFYSRMKGELDNFAKTLDFASIHLIKPSVLSGNRQENRSAERFGIAAGNIICKLPFLKKYRPITDKTVAKAMINCALNPGKGKFTHELGEVHDLTK